MMSSVVAGEMRERMTRAVEEVQGYERLRVFADATQRECERLRQEVEHFRAETERYRGERKEIADSLSQFIEVLAQFKRRM